MALKSKLGEAAALPALIAADWIVASAGSDYRIRGGGQTPPHADERDIGRNEFAVELIPPMLYLLVAYACTTVTNVMSSSPWQVDTVILSLSALFGVLSLLSLIAFEFEFPDGSGQEVAD